MPWPKYFADRLIVGNTDSDTAIATLWTPMNVVAQMTDVSKVSIIGQLYTKRGINYLIRNILLNPKITRLMLVGADLMGAGEALLRISDFRFQISELQTSRATARGTINLKSEILSLKLCDWLDEAIDPKAIADFANHVVITNHIGPVARETVQKFISGSNIGKPWAKSRRFAEPAASNTNSLPSEETAFVARGGKVWETWLRLLQQITRFGRPSPMVHHYGSERISELMNLVAVVTQEDVGAWELPSWFPYSKSDIQKYTHSFLSASRGDEAYTYGERLKAYPLEGYSSEFLNFTPDVEQVLTEMKLAISGKKLNQVELMAKKLQSFPENKGALAVLWEPVIDNFGLREIWRTPCLVLVQAMVYSDKLSLTAYFRSNDMFGGWPLNAFGLRAFQRELADMVDKNLQLGPLTTISQSAHIYESSWQAAEKLIQDHWVDVACQWDPRGNLNVEVIGKEIVIKYLSPDGILLHEFRYDGTKEKAARDFCFQLETAGLFSTIGNAMYAARQIERAETAIKLGLPFMSDMPLHLS